MNGLIFQLEELKFAVFSLAGYGHASGSHERENARNIAEGINHRIDWLVGEFRKLAPKPEGEKK